MTPPDTASARSLVQDGDTPGSNEPAVHTQAEYEAIRQAMMETSRGRWFLDEFASANRNADTSAVLAAVARLEQAMAAKLRVAPEPVPEPVAATEAASEPLDSVSAAEPIPDAISIDIAALRDRLASIEAMMIARADGLTAVTRHTAKLQEMIWTLREGGADFRICNLLGMQTDTISRGHTELSAADTDIAAAIADLLSDCDPDGPAPTSYSAEADPLPAASIPDEAIADVDQSDIDDVLAPIELAIEASGDAVRNEALAAEAARALDAELAAVAAALFEEPPTPSAGTATFVEPPRTLGDAVLAGGIVQRPSPAPSDPMAAIRRMSQAEKVAFFT